MTEAVEHSDRARYVTEQIGVWIANDGDYYDEALRLAEHVKDDDSPWSESTRLRRFSGYLTETLNRARRGSTAWYVRRDLSDNDLANRVDWEEIAADLLSK